MLIHQNKVITLRFRAETGILKAIWNFDSEVQPETIERALRLFRDSTQSVPLLGLLISISEADFPAQELLPIIKEQCRIAISKSANLKIGIGLPLKEMAKADLSNGLAEAHPDNRIRVLGTEEEALTWLTQQVLLTTAH